MTRKEYVSVDQRDLGGFVSTQDEATLEEVATAFDISQAQAKRKLDGLVYQGLLESQGNRYFVPGSKS